MSVSELLSQIRRTCWIIGGLFLLLPGVVSGQLNTPFSAAVLVGPTSYDLSGTGTSIVVAGELDYVPVMPLILEAGVTYFGYTDQSDHDIRILFPELSVQGQVPIRAIRPYLGGGVGRSIVLSGERDSQLTLHGVLGLRIQFGSRWGVRGELRVRAIDPFVGSMADVAFGVVRRL